MKKLSTLNRRRLIRVGVLCVVIPSLAYLGRSQPSPVGDTFIHQPNSIETYCEAGEYTSPDTLLNNEEIKLDSIAAIGGHIRP